MTVDHRKTYPIAGAHMDSHADTKVTDTRVRIVEDILEDALDGYGDAHAWAERIVDALRGH